MTERTKAIVLNKTKYSDNSLIVNLLTEKYGRLAVIIKSSRSKKSNTRANIFFPLNIIDIIITYRSNRNIQLVKDGNSVYTLIDIHTNIYKSCIAQFIAEIIQKSVKEEVANDTVFDFLEQSILSLEKLENKFGGYNITFLIDFAIQLGFKPSDNYCDVNSFFNIREGMFLPLCTSSEESMNDVESTAFYQLLCANGKARSVVNMPYKLRTSILDYLIKYYKYHIISNQEVKSLSVLKCVFE